MPINAEKPELRLLILLLPAHDWQDQRGGVRRVVVDRLRGGDHACARRGGLVRIQIARPTWMLRAGYHQADAMPPLEALRRRP